MASNNDSYWSRSWALLTRDKGWFKPLLVLSAVNFVPIIGQFGAQGYALEWGRLTAWGVDSSPKQKGVDVGGCIKSGARAFVVSLGLGLMIGLVRLVLSSVLGNGLGTLIGAVLGIAGVVLVSVATLRATIYQSIGAGYQLDRIFDMVKRDYKGLLRIVGMLALFSVAIGMAVGVLVSIVMFANAGALIELVRFIDNEAYIDDMQVVLAVLGWISSMLPALMVVAYLVGIVTSGLNLLMTTAVALWMRQFDVQHWGESSDPLPQTSPAAPAAGATPQASAYPQAGAPAAGSAAPEQTTWADPAPMPQEHAWSDGIPMVSPMPASIQDPQSSPATQESAVPQESTPEVPTFTLDDYPARETPANESTADVPTFTLDDYPASAATASEPEQDVPSFTLDDYPVNTTPTTEADVPTFTLEDAPAPQPAQEDVTEHTPFSLDSFAREQPERPSFTLGDEGLEDAVAQSRAFVEADLVQPVTFDAAPEPEVVAEPEPAPEPEVVPEIEATVEEVPEAPEPIVVPAAEAAEWPEPAPVYEDDAEEVVEAEVIDAPESEPEAIDEPEIEPEAPSSDEDTSES